MKAILSPTFNLPPSWTQISVSIPSSGDSHSMVALSVSISASTSPADTWSPFFFFHATRVPSVIVSLSLGIWISGMVNNFYGYRATPLHRATLTCNFSNSLTDFTHSRPVSQRRQVSRHSAVPRARGVRCMALGHLPVIRGESAHPAHQKCLFESGSKFLPRRRRTGDPVQQSPRDVSLRLSRKSPVHRAA